MKKLSLMFLSLAFLSSLAFANVAVGNKNCPLSGSAVEGGAIVEYQGKSYGLCCERCIKKFNANPEEYVKNLGE